MKTKVDELGEKRAEILAHDFENPWKWFKWFIRRVKDYISYLIWLFPKPPEERRDDTEKITSIVSNRDNC